MINASPVQDCSDYAEVRKLSNPPAPMLVARFMVPPALKELKPGEAAEFPSRFSTAVRQWFQLRKAKFVIRRGLTPRMSVIWLFSEPEPLPISQAEFVKERNAARVRGEVYNSPTSEDVLRYFPQWADGSVAPPAILKGSHMAKPI